MLQSLRTACLIGTNHHDMAIEETVGISGMAETLVSRIPID